MIEKVYAPKAIGAVRRGKVVMFTGCSTAQRKNVRYPQVKPTTWDADKRWHKALYVWADVKNEFGLKRRMGLLLPVKVLDKVLEQIHLPLMSANGKHKHWTKLDADENTIINCQLVQHALNHHTYDIVWRCDEENGRVVYDLVIND